MKFFNVLLILFGISVFVQAQTVPWVNIKQADEAYKARDYKRADSLYKPLMVYYNNKKDLVKAARCAAQVGDTTACLNLLERAYKRGWSNSAMLLSDGELTPVEKLPRFLKVVELMKAFEKRQAAISPELHAMLKQMEQDDQKIRGNGIDDPDGQYLLDSLNFIKLEKIIAEHGWLGENLLGGDNGFWLVIQHQPLHKQMKYQALMEAAALKGEEDVINYAYLEDRILIKTGKLQKYGTQVDTENKRAFPIDKPEEVDIRRASIGLGSLRDYLKRWGIKI